MISVVLPTYNEVENIEEIIPRISNTLSDRELEIIVVDDDSPDGTAERARSLEEEYPVRVIHRKKERGLATAVMDGFAAAKGEICVVMDADLSHPVDKLPDMLEPIAKGEYEATIGSRYIPGGGCSNWSQIRQFISRGAGFLAVGLTKLSDPTSGFMAIRKELLNGKEFTPVGWKIVLEVITKTDAKFLEVPIVFADRYKGESKLTAQVQIQYLQHLWKLYDFKLPKVLQFIRFCSVGFSGLIIDTLLLLLTVEGFGLDPRIGAAFSFLAAVTWNYFLNRDWTFNYGLSKPPFFKGLFSFISVCLFGLCVRVSVLHLLLSYTFLGTGRLYIVANFIGVICSTIMNFIGSRKLVFYKNLVS